MRRKLMVCGSSDFASIITAWEKSSIPKMLPLPIPDVTVNTRKGVFVNYAPAEIAG